MPKDRDAKRKRRQRKAAEKASVSRTGDEIRTTLSGEKDVSSLGLQSCQEEGLSRFRDVKGKPDQEKVASSDKMSREKKCQAERLTQPTAVTARQSGVVPRGSPFSSWASTLFETCVTQLARALVVFMIFLYIYIYYIIIYVCSLIVYNAFVFVHIDRGK